MSRSLARILGFIGVSLSLLIGQDRPVVFASQHTMQAQIDDAIRFRSGFALRDDYSFVAASIDDPSYESTVWGVPLSAQEGAEMDRRLKVREAFQPLLEQAVDAPGYAGAYLDHERGGLPVLLTSEIQSFRSAIEGSLASKVEHEVREVEFDLAELEAVRDRIDTATETIRADGIHIVSIGLNTIGNRVSVGVQGLNDGSLAYLREQFGPTIVPTEDSPAQSDACTNMENCWPMKGGLHIHLTANPGPTPCTGGFIAAKSDTGALGMVTAGHCLALANNMGIDYWGHASSPVAAQNFGEERLNTWFDDSLADVGFIIFDLDTVVQLGAPNALHYLDPTGNGSIFAIRANNSQLPNDPVCRMGW